MKHTDNLEERLRTLEEQAASIRDDATRRDVDRQIAELRSTHKTSLHELEKKLEAGERIFESAQRRQEFYSSVAGIGRGVLDKSGDILDAIKDKIGDVVYYGRQLIMPILAVGLVCAIGYGMYVYVAKPFVSEITGQSTVEKYEREHPVFLEKVFKGQSFISESGYNLGLDDVINHVYSPNKERVAILYSGGIVEPESIFVFTLVGNDPNMREIVKVRDTKYNGDDFIELSDIFWEDDDTLTFKKRMDSLGMPRNKYKTPYTSVDIDDKNVGHNMRERVIEEQEHETHR